MNFKNNIQIIYYFFVWNVIKNVRCENNVPIGNKCNVPDGTTQGVVDSPNIYFLCMHGEVFKVTCPDRMVYVEGLNGCVLDVEVEKDNLNACIGRRNETNVENKENCRKFFRCIDRLPHEQTCSPGYYFDKEKLICVKGDDCPEDICTQSDVADNYIVAHKECDRYYICSQRQPIEHWCGFGNLFDTNTNQCIPDEHGLCDSKRRTIEMMCDMSNEITFYKYENDCTKFLNCNNSTLSIDQCPSGMHFDSEKNICIDGVECLGTNQPSENSNMMSEFFSKIFSLFR